MEKKVKPCRKGVEKSKPKAEKKPKRQDVVFDDDTSDSSDDEQIELFKQQLSKTTKSKIEDQEDTDESDNADDFSHDEDESDASEDEDDEEASDEEKDVQSAQLNDKVSKLKSQLEAMNNSSSDDEQDDDEISSGDESEEDEQENEDEGGSNDEQENRETDNIKTTKRKTEAQTELSKRQKLEEESSDDEADRQAFRAELSSMSIEEIQKLKEKIGLKLYNQAIGAVKTASDKKAKKVEFKRENKNRPREVSAKVKVGRLRDVVGFKLGVAKKSEQKRDPRFDALCGTFDEKVFRKQYEFVDSLKSKEREKLKKELETETDEERIKQIKYLIQRMDNQEREKQKLLKQKSNEEAERKMNRELIKEGKKPVFMSKAERKAKELVDKYEELTEAGKLDNYMQRKQKKNLGKERKKLKK